MSLQQTSSQTVGPFFILGLQAGVVADLAKDHGNPIVIRGRVLDGAGQPVPDALIETWQADAAGRYAHPEDPRCAEAQPGFHGYGRVPTDADGRFALRTIKPGRVPGPDSRLQAPHLAVQVLMRGLLRHLPTRLYFGDEAAANAEDALLALLPAARRASLVSTLETPGEHAWEIHMQGTRETVFLDF